MVVDTISVRPLSPELAEVARVELNETPKRLEEGIRILKEWISQQPYLRARTDDQWLAAFLRGCKHSIEGAKRKIDIYYTLRSVAPEMTALKHNDPKFIEFVKSGLGLILPKRAHPTAPRVVIVRARCYNPKKFTPPDFFAVSLVSQAITYLEDDPFMVCGTIVVFDLKGVSTEYLMQMNPLYLKMLITAGQDGSPIRLREIHIFGMPSYFEGLFNFSKKLLNEKNRNRLFVQSGGVDEIRALVGKEILPVEYGGDAGTEQDIIDYWLKKIKEYGPWLEEDLQYGTDESKRPGKPKTTETEFGVAGSFRQLEFD